MSATTLNDMTYPTQDDVAARVVVLGEHLHALGDRFDVLGARLRVARFGEDFYAAAQLDVAGLVRRAAAEAGVAGRDPRVGERDLRGVLVRAAE